MAKSNDAAALETPEYAQLKTKLADREWRLDNLYWIIDENGNRIRFVRNEAQRILSAEMHPRDIIAKGRKIGFSTFIAILICDSCVFRSNTVCGIVDRTLDDAEDKLAIVAFAYDNLPAEIRAERPTLRRNTKEIFWNNGSSVTVGISYRGGTPAILHISEFGKISVDAPDQAKEIKTGGIEAVPMGGKVFVESTAHGTSGEFYDMVKRARDIALEGRPLTNLDFKLHFFGWWRKKENRLPNNLVTVPIELKEYFQEQEAKYGIKLDADQRAWYAKKHADLGPDDVKSEHPTSPEELFFNAIEGAYFKRELSKARIEKRIGQPVPFDPTFRVNTTWDIGEDCTAIWFHQSDGLRHRFIDYWEEEGGSLQSACGIVAQKQRERGFVYGTHYGPHDLENRSWENQATPRVKIAEGLGVRFKIVPRVAAKGDSIEAARRLIGMSWFDSEHCERGVQCLDNYRKKWNERMGMFMADPIHDFASHGADSYQGLAMEILQEKAARQTDRNRRLPERKATAWSA